MEIKHEYPRDGYVVVSPEGRVDAESAPELRDKLKALAASAPKVIVIDLAQVDFIDSSGLSALVSGMKAVRKGGGSISLSRPRSQALTALRLTLLDRVFPIFPSIEEALNQSNPLLS